MIYYEEIAVKITAIRAVYPAVCKIMPLLYHLYAMKRRSWHNRDYVVSGATYGFNTQGRYTPSGTSATYLSGVCNVESKIADWAIGILFDMLWYEPLTNIDDTNKQARVELMFPVHTLDTEDTTIFIISSEMLNVTSRMNTIGRYCPLDSYLWFRNKFTPNSNLLERVR